MSAVALAIPAAQDDGLHTRFAIELAAVEAATRPTLDEMLDLLDRDDARECASLRAVVLAGYHADFPAGGMRDVVIRRKVLAVVQLFRDYERDFRAVVQAKKKIDQSNQFKKRRA